MVYEIKGIIIIIIIIFIQTIIINIYIINKLWADKKNQKLEKERKQKEISEQKECPFRPTIKNDDGNDDGNLIRSNTTIVERFMEAKKKVLAILFLPLSSI